MYRSLEELCRMERETGKPFWKIVQEDDCVEQGISAEESFAQMRGMYQAMQYADAHYDETNRVSSFQIFLGTFQDGIHSRRTYIQCAHIQSF